MTYPVGPTPDGAYVVGSDYGQSITEDSARAIMTGGARATWSGAQNKFRLRFNPIERQLTDTFVDGQRTLNGRLELLEDVSGYCNLVMSKSWTVAGGQAIPIPFDSRVAPMKNARPYSGVFTPDSKLRYGILLEAAGTWRIDSHVTFGPGNGETNAELYLSTWNKDTRELYSERMFYARMYQQRRSYTLQHTVVVSPELAGKLVACCTLAHGGAWWPVLGGDRHSALSVNRWDLNSSGPGNSTGNAPDGGNYD